MTHVTLTTNYDQGDTHTYSHTSDGYPLDAAIPVIASFFHDHAEQLKGRIQTAAELARVLAGSGLLVEGPGNGPHLDAEPRSQHAEATPDTHTAGRLWDAHAKVIRGWARGLFPKQSMRSGMPHGKDEPCENADCPWRIGPSISAAIKQHMMDGLGKDFTGNPAISVISAASYAAEWMLEQRDYLAGMWQGCGTTAVEDPLPDPASVPTEKPCQPLMVEAEVQCGDDGSVFFPQAGEVTCTREAGHLGNHFDGRFTSGRVWVGSGRNIVEDLAEFHRLQQRAVQGEDNWNGLRNIKRDGNLLTRPCPQDSWILHDAHGWVSAEWDAFYCEGR